MTIEPYFQKSQPSRSWTQISFLAIAVLFNLCLVAQLLTVGLAIFHDPTKWWSIHVWLVRSYGGLVVVLLTGLVINPFPRKIQMLTASIAILLLLQFITIHLNYPLLGVLHPLLGFVLFTSSTTLVHRAWREVFNDLETATLT